MHTFFSVFLTVLFSLTLLGPVQAETVSTDAAADATASATGQQVQKLLTGLPLSFIPNQGQADKQVKYLLHGRDTQMYFTAKGLTMVLTEPGKKEEPRRERPRRRSPNPVPVGSPSWTLWVPAAISNSKASSAVRRW